MRFRSATEIGEIIQKSEKERLKESDRAMSTRSMFYLRRKLRKANVYEPRKLPRAVWVIEGPQKPSFQKLGFVGRVDLL